MAASTPAAIRHCGNVCADDQFCANGVCRGCPSGAVLCGGSCVPACPDGQVMTDDCRCVCAAGTIPCAGGCVNTDTDPANCGDCGNACPVPDHATATCTGGQCAFTCDQGFLREGDGCVPAPECSNADECPEPTEACRVATCIDNTCGVGPAADNTNTGCDQDQICCGGACVSNTTTTNCGTCGTACTGDQTCIGGTCTGDCQESNQSCTTTDDCCPDLRCDTNCDPPTCLPDFIACAPCATAGQDCRFDRCCDDLFCNAELECEACGTSVFDSCGGFPSQGQCCDGYVCTGSFMEVGWCIPALA